MATASEAQAEASLEKSPQWQLFLSYLKLVLVEFRDLDDPSTGWDATMCQNLSVRIHRTFSQSNTPRLDSPSGSVNAVANVV